ncbi:putative regulatory protein [[Actinomadura] parvosata subsp. kistnae]|uniref:macro domain-containing protein n=1 Tax=[Actinomadura] parvosata TaxID=1955412 RepID=UPI000D28AC10|nr:macro domain-containing protein [Nonomuraea sp. ATCC 55076]SPL91886.1 putative regulatory protein [Actinomadura parvosata subsp. kistnae]
MRLIHGLRQVFRTSRGRVLLATQFFIAFGVVSAGVQFVGQVFGVRFGNPGGVTAISLGACLAWGVLAAYSRGRVSRDFPHPDMTITIQVGDLFAQEADLVVGFTDTFDLDTTDDSIINRNSLQGQLLSRLYEDDLARLDGELKRALTATVPVAAETAESKPRGKRDRYPLGTVAVIGSPRRRIYCLAYSRMGNDLVARSSVDDLWAGLARLWAAIGDHSQLGHVAVPVMGAELARVHALDRENLLKVIILSFVAHSRMRPVCRRLSVIIRPEDVEKVDLLEMRAFLTAL